jgi:hypothetical protein
MAGKPGQFPAQQALYWPTGLEGVAIFPQGAGPLAYGQGSFSGQHPQHFAGLAQAAGEDHLVSRVGLSRLGQGQETHPQLPSLYQPPARPLVTTPKPTRVRSWPAWRASSRMWASPPRLC